MRKLIVNTFVSLDGVMQAPGGPDEDPGGGFAHGGWAVPHFDDEMMARMAASGPYELVLGRGTYEIFAAHWPYDEGPIADHLNGTAKHVASTTLDRADWNNSTLITGGTVPTALRLVGHDVTSTGVTISTYERAGAIEAGSFEFDEPTEAELERRRLLQP